MPEILDLIGGVEDYQFTTELNGDSYRFQFQWNERDEAWFFHVWEIDGTAIMHGVKVVLGTFLGRAYQHRLVSAGALIAADVTGSDTDATFEDLGTRVVIAHWTAFELAAEVRTFGLTVAAE